MKPLDNARQYYDHVIEYIARIKNYRKMKKALGLELGSLVSAEISLEKPCITYGKKYSVLSSNPVYISNGSKNSKLEDVLFRFIDDRTTIQELSCANFRY